MLETTLHMPQFWHLQHFNRLKTPRNSFRDFRADKTCTTLKFESLPVTVSLGNHPLRLFQKIIDVLTAKSIAKLLRLLFRTAWAGLTDKHIHSVS